MHKYKESLIDKLLSIEVIRLIFLIFSISMLSANSPSFNFRQGEFLVDTSFAYLPAYGSQKEPAIAFDGTNYFVVWTDGREEPGVYGTRVNQAGEVLDSAGIVIAYTNGGGDGDPKGIAFDGSNYLVVLRYWQDGGGGADLYGIRVTRDGVVLDTAKFPICQTHHAMEPSVVYGGAYFLVVWPDWFTGSVCGARVTSEGTLIDTASIFISASADYAAAAFDGTNYYVVFTKGPYNETDIYGARINQSGTVLDPGGLPVCVSGGEQLLPSVAFDGTNYFVIWEDNSYNTDIYGARVNQSGILIDTGGIAITTAASVQDRSSIAFVGTNYFAAWSDYRNAGLSGADIYGARVTTEGVVLDPSGILIHADSAYEWSPEIAFGTTDYLVVWEASDYASYNVRGARIDPAGIVIDTTGMTISYAAEFQHAAGVAFDGADYLTIWKQQNIDPSVSDIYGMRVSSLGSPIDSAKIYINSAEGWIEQPALAAGDSTFLITWEQFKNNNEVRFTRMSRSGAVLDTGMMLSISGIKPAAAFDGVNYLVVWSDNRNGLNYDIYGARIDESGTVIDPNGFMISNAFSAQNYPYAAFNGHHYLVVWKECRNDRWDIYGARVLTSGAVLDTAGIAICFTPCNKGYPAVASDGNNFLVTWCQESYEYQVWGVRVSSDGIVLDSAEIFIARGNDASVTFDGQQYIVPYTSLSMDAYAQIVNQDGSLGDTITVCSGDGDQCAPFAAVGSGDSMLFIYSGWTEKINSRPANNFRVWGKLYPFTAVEENTKKEKKPSRFSITVAPNPFTSGTKIVISMTDLGFILDKEQSAEQQELSVKIYDITGRLVRNFSVSPHASMSRTWNGTDQAGAEVPAGVYFIQASWGEAKTVGKVVKLE